MRLGVIGGGGWLGGAIVGAVLDAGLVRAEDVSLSYRSVRPDRFPGAFWTMDSQALADRSDVIIVSVRPADWPSLAVDAHGKLVISMMAGIRLAAIADHHGTSRAVRTMPNAAAELGKSYTPWVATAETSAEDRGVVRAIFDACGQQDEVGSERDIDYLTGLAGSGPAFPALLGAAMMRAAIAHGLPPEIAQRAAKMVLAGAGPLIERRGEPLDKTVQAFLAYRGTTAAGIEAMRAAGFDEAVRKGLEAAFEKSISMGGE